MLKNSLTYAIYKRARISPKKVVPVLDLIRGRGLYDAKVILATDPTKAAKMILKTLKSAEANAKNNLEIGLDDLFVHETWVSSGRTAKSGRFVGRGNFSPILKRTSHIYVGLNERAKK